MRQAIRSAAAAVIAIDRMTGERAHGGTDHRTRGPVAGPSDAVAEQAGELAGTVAQDPAGIGARALEMLVTMIKDATPIDMAADVPVEYVAAQLITKQ